MPQLNGTGPQGNGSFTGRGQGKCKIDKTDRIEDLSNDSEPRGLGRGRGRGMRGGGKGKGFHAYHSL